MRDDGGAPQTPLTAPPADTATKRILFVDRRRDTFEGLREALRPSGALWQVEYAAGGDEALALIDEAPADVVVADEQLTAMDGVTLLARVRDRHPTTIRMIMSGTARPGPATIVAHRVLAKPCNVGELGVLIKRSWALHKRTGEALALRQTMSASALPSRPSAYMELNQVLGDPTWQPAQVAAVIERDVALSAKVLQLANSALFGLVSTVSSVRDAVVYLGIDTIRSLALTAEAFGKLAPRSSEGFSLDAFQDHAMLVARLTASIVPAGRAQQEAVTAALLHDVGKLVAISDGSSRWSARLAEARTRRQPLYEIELEHDGVSHADVGAYLLSLWGLPDAIVEPVASHHSPASVPGLAFDGVAAVHIANALAHELETGVDDGPPPATIDGGLVERLGLGTRLDLWRQRARQLISEPSS